MASNTPDVRILVGNLGDASPSGESAALIRTNLEKALSAGIKIKITPDTTALTGSSGKSTAFADFTGATVSKKAMSQATAELTRQRLAHNAALQKENLAHQQNINASKQAIQASKEEAQAAKTRTTIMAEELKQNQLNTKAEQQRVQALLQSEKVIASRKMQLANLNQYLTTVNPKALTEFSGEIAKIRALLASDMPGAAQKASVEITKLKASIKDAGYEGGNAITYINAKLETFATYLVSSAVTMGFVNGVRTMIENVKDLDKALTDLRIVTGSTREETQELLKTYNQMAQQLGTTTMSVSEGAVDWLRQGYSEEDARELLTQSMTLSIVGDMDSVAATESLTSAMKGYSLSVSEASDVVDKFFQVDMKAATSSEDMALALAKTAANAKLAGLSLDDVIGQLAVVNETMKEAGESTGTFYNTMLSRMSYIKAGRMDDPETGESLNTWGIAA